MNDASTETIFAIATPPGSGGIGVVRLSGPRAVEIGCTVTGQELEPRRAHFARFLNAENTAIDSGIALYFPGPNSFTGEDVVELQGHAGPVVQQMLARRLASLGARQARAGEFSERAFLNDRMDLVQAEAIADLVASGTEAAARAAQRSLEGVFSGRVTEIQQQLTELRVFIEAALDFPDEEIDFIAESDVLQRLENVQAASKALFEDAHQGQILRDGVTIAILGAPNAGKSSLLNALSGRDSAIVTDIPGTTRDVLRETLSLEGLPVHIADTAGIRESIDRVEAEGIRRARNTIQAADLVLLVLDETAGLQEQLQLQDEIPASTPCIQVFNKADLAGRRPGIMEQEGQVAISALSGSGLGQLVALILETVGVTDAREGAFSARTRHLEALRATQAHLEAGRVQLVDFNSGETLAEELRLAQRELGEITGQFLPDDLLGAIFASFCIGK